MRDRLNRLLALTVGSVFATVVVQGIQTSVIGYPWYVYATALLLGANVLLLARRPGGTFFINYERTFLLVAIVVFVVSRLAWILIVPTVPTSDWSLYNSAARLVAEGQSIYDDFGCKIHLNQWGYPLVLGAVYAYFGKSLLVAKLFNLLVGALTLYTLFRLAKQMVGPRVARLAVSLFVLWPSQLAMTSVLSNDHLGLLLSLVAIGHLGAVLRDETHLSQRDMIVAGASLGLAYIVRATAIVVIGVGFIALAATRHALSWKMRHVLPYAASLALTYGAYLSGMALAYGEAPITTGTLSLLIGTNAESGGTWNQEDAGLYLAYSTCAEGSRAAREEAFRRIAGNPAQFGTLMARKVVITWERDQYGVHWSTIELEDTPRTARVSSCIPLLDTVSQFFYQILLVFTIAGSLQIAMKDRLDLTFVWLVVLLATLFHSIVETQARYHYLLVPLLTIVASVGLSGPGDISSSQANSV